MTIVTADYVEKVAGRAGFEPATNWVKAKYAKEIDVKYIRD